MAKNSIKRMMRERGWTMERLASRMTGKDGEQGISQGAVSQIINGNPTLSKLEEVASILNCRVADLVDDGSDFVAFVRSGGVTHTFDSERELAVWLTSRSDSTNP